MTKPGEAIETYLKRDRNKLVEPVRFSLVVLAITTVVFLNLGGQDYLDGFLKGLTDNRNIEKIEIFVNIFEKYCNLFLIFVLPITSLFSFHSFKQSGYNGAEHLVINAYIFSFQSLIFIVGQLLLSWYSDKGILLVFLLSTIY